MTRKSALSFLVGTLATQIFLIREKQQLEARLEAFNWLNHVVFGNPSVNLSDTNFGKITTGATEEVSRSL